MRHEVQELCRFMTFLFPLHRPKNIEIFVPIFSCIWYFWCFYILVLWALIMLLLKFFFGYFFKQVLHKKSFVEDGSPSKLQHGRKMMSMMLWIEKKNIRCMKLEFTKPLFNKVFIKVILSSTLSLGHFSPPVPSLPFDEVRKVRKFY
jgi:hypothetical protein